MKSRSCALALALMCSTVRAQEGERSQWEIRDIRVDMTFVGGELKYSRPGSRAGAGR